MRRERLHWLLSLVAACKQVEVLPRLLHGAAPSDAPSTLVRYEDYLMELVGLDLVWIHRGPRGAPDCQFDNTRSKSPCAHSVDGTTG